MTTKIKIIIGLLALVAAIVLYTSYNAVQTLSKRYTGSSNITSGAVLAAPEADDDHDGLSNLEESIWNTDFQNPDTDGDGFLDGEEVLSGHDPTIPGPDDLLFSSLDVAGRVTSLVLGGILDGSLKPSSPDYQKSVNLVVDDFFAQIEAQVSIPTAHVTTVPSTPESRKKYTVELANRFMPAMRTLSADMENIIELIGDIDVSSPYAYDRPSLANLESVARDTAARLNSQTNALVRIEVPEDMASFHAALLETLRKIEKNILMTGQLRKDPALGVFAFTVAVNTYTEDLPTLIADLYELLTSQR